MPKYLITLTMHETYELLVEAENEEVAMQGARDTDISTYHSHRLYTQTGVITYDETIEEAEVLCKRCETPVVFDDVSEDYYAVCPKHDEDLYLFETFFRTNTREIDNA